MSKKITPHLIKVFLAFKNSSNQWLTVAQAATKAGININTTKHHIRFFVKEKILEVVNEMRPHCYKFSDAKNERADEIERLTAIVVDEFEQNC